MTPPKISIVIPCFHRFMDWACGAEHSLLYSDLRVELVLVADENSEESLYHQWINRNSRRFRCRLLVNDNHPGTWRPPSIPINAGIRHSLGEWVIVQSPESVALFPSVNYLFEVISKQEKPFFLTGLLASVKPYEIRDGSSFQHFYRNKFSNATRGFGWILFRRNDAIKIGGFDEKRERYGNDDDCFRRRLAASGLQHICDEAIRTIHVDRRTHDRDTSNMEPMTETVRLPRENMGKGFRKSYEWMDAA